jgi:hypothetical protein
VTVHLADLDDRVGSLRVQHPALAAAANHGGGCKAVLQGGDELIIL